MKTIHERVRDLLTHHTVLEDEAVVRYVPELAYEYDRNTGQTTFNKELDDLITRLGVKDEKQNPEERAAVGQAILIPAQILVKYLD